MIPVVANSATMRCGITFRFWKWLSKRATTPAGGTVSTLGDLTSSFTDQLADNAPQVLLFSNGETNAFALTMTRDGVGRSVTLQSSADGTIQASDILEPKK